jgi:hypothetical protein
MLWGYWSLLWYRICLQPMSECVKTCTQCCQRPLTTQQSQEAQELPLAVTGGSSCTAPGRYWRCSWRPYNGCRGSDSFIEWTPLPRVPLPLQPSAILLLHSTVDLATANHILVPVSAGYSASVVPVSFNCYVCCNCYDHCSDWIHWTFFGSRRAADLHISKSPHYREARKGVKTVTQMYRDSQRAEDSGQEARPVGAPGTWPARPAGMQHIVPDIGNGYWYMNSALIYYARHRMLFNSISVYEDIVVNIRLNIEGNKSQIGASSEYQILHQRFFFDVEVLTSIYGLAKNLGLPPQYWVRCSTP